ncbi:hypothetical protein BC833DRAFT_575239 [Globomyces pollinis-pini]|nr:hypothetical protein BC833DRAFT_575239 [Globomyces pollinis-pini]
MDNTTSIAAEHFSGLRKDIKNKFVTEASISKDQTPEEEPKKNDAIPFDPRPLHVRLAETRQIKDDEMNEIYRLANRIRKLDEDFQR